MSGMIQAAAATEGSAENVPRGADQQDHAHQHESQWFLDDVTPGTGARPEWLDAKFKSVKDVVQSYKELEKRLGSNHGAPETYDPKEYGEMFAESPLLPNLTNKAKELKLSQETFEAVLSEFATYQKSLMPNIDEEMKKLGENPQRRLDTVNQWATNNLSPKAIETLGKISYTAEVVELMDELRQMHFNTASRVPTGAQAQEKFKVLTSAEVEAEMHANYPRYQADPSYRAEISRKFAQAIGEE